MAFADHYVLPTAAGLADGTSWANAFDLAGSQAHAVGKVGQRYNLKGDFGTIAAGTWTTGNFQQPNVWRGCENEPGDLDNRKRNADGTLNVTGFPTFTLSANAQTYGIVNIVFQNINYTADINTYMTTNASDDGVQFINCRFENSNAGTGARIFNADNSWTFINCDLIINSSTATTQTIGTADASLTLIQCRIESTNAASLSMIIANAGIRADGCVFIGGGNNYALAQDSAGAAAVYVNNCTFYNIDTCWRCVLTHTGGRLGFYNNLMVNCRIPVDFNVATAPMLFYFNNRVRNVVSPPFNSNFSEIVAFNTNAVDADDFVDPVNGNFNLLPTSPAVNAGTDYSNIGALDFLLQESGGVYNPFQQQRIR